MQKIIPVILCGGSGERLWPMSNTLKPKQFLKILSEYSLLQETVKRLSFITEYDVSDVVIVTLSQWKEEATAQVTALNLPYNIHCLCEPIARGTLPALTLASLYVQANFNSNSLCWILPSDHHIDDPKLLSTALDEAVPPALDNYSVTIGIKPSEAETAYGYLQVKKPLSYRHVYEVARFIEKPHREEAESFVKNGDYLWSSGMHLVQNDRLISMIEEWAPDGLHALEECNDLKCPSTILYHAIPKGSFEKEVLEKCSNLAVVEVGFSWSDIGRWRTIWDAAPKNDDGNVIRGNVFCDDVQNSLIFGGSRGISCVGLKNAVVIENEEGILVASIDTAYTRGNSK